MADAYTALSTLNFDQVAWNKEVLWPYRANLMFDQMATIKGGTYHPGSSVSFLFWSDLADATTALSETADVDAVALADTTASITLVEQGNAVIPTAKVRATAFSDVDRGIANIVGRNAASTMDTIAKNIVAAGTNVYYGSGGAGTPTTRAGVGTGINADDTLAPTDVHNVVGRMRADDVPGLDGELYGGVMHPHVGVDFRDATDASGWLVPANYSEASRRWRAETGTFGGVRWVESSRAPTWVNGGEGGAVDVYGTVIIGEGGIGKAWGTGGGYDGGPNPTVVKGLPVDKLMRFHPIGWKQLVGYGILRQAAVRRIESSSTLGTNV